MAAADFDVLIVGASIAGCTAARLLAQQGLQVALVDQHVDIDWHKRLCTHYIQACAVPTVQRLGLEPLIEAAGGVRSRVEIWTRWGWVRHGGRPDPATFGYSVRRQTLDPILRQLAAETPGVELMLGWKAQELLRDGDRVCGAVLRDGQRQTRELRAKLVVAADGRHSSLVELAGIKTNSAPNNRFTYFAYYRNLPLTSGADSQFWMLDPDVAYALPNEDDITLVAAWITKDQLEAFRQDREGAFDRFVQALPDGLDFSRAERISDILGAVDLPVEGRRPAQPGLALIGDAAFAPDPLWGVGCGWAFCSAAWLADCVGPALASGADLDAALKKYRKRHWNELAAHHLLIADYARGRRFYGIERLYYSAATRSPAVAEMMLGFGARRVHPLQLVSPIWIGRAIAAHLRRRPKPTPAAVAGSETSSVA